LDPSAERATAVAAHGRHLAVLVERIGRGDQDALAALYDESSSLVYGLASRILRDEAAAEDVTLEVYTQAYRQASTYDAQRGSPLAWLMTMTRSRAIDRLRAESRTRRWEESLEAIENFPAGTAGPDERSVVAEDQARVRAALAALGAEHRQVIEMAYYGGLTHREIAAALGQPLGTVKTRIRAGMMLLRDWLLPRMTEAVP
jgi:RNA polymerase sigma-70 factor, ECF subfamily